MADPTAEQPIVTPDGWKKLVRPDETVPVPAEPVQRRQVGPLPEEKPELGLWETYSRTFDQDSPITAMSRMAAQAGFTYDPSYRLPEFGTPEFKKLTEGIPEDQWDKLGAAVDADHAQWIADHIRESNSAEQLLAERGDFGIAGRFVIDMMDPVGFALGTATGGIGTVGKGLRLVRTARALEAAGDLAGSRVALDAASEFTSKVSVGKNIVKQGALAASLNAALAETTVQGDPARDQWDVAHAALTGFLLGGAASGIFGRSEIGRLRSSLADTQQQLGMRELNAHIEVKKAEILDRLAHGEHVSNLKNAQDDLATLQAEIEHRAQVREDDLRSRAAPGPNDKELAKAAKARKKAQTGVNEADASLERIRDRYREQDLVVHGDQADDPAIAKLREKAVQRDWRAGKARAQDTLDRATLEHERLLDAHSARTQLNEVLKSRKEAPEDALGRLGDADQMAYAKKLEDQQAQVTKALGLSKKAEDDAHAQLQKLQDVQTHGKIALASMTPEEAVQTADVFGEGSQGAARFKGLYESVNDEFESPAGAPMARQAFSKVSRKLGIFSSILRGNENDVVRSELGPYVGDTVGTVDGSVSTIGASEHARQLSRRYVVKFNKAVNESYDAWRKKQGYSVRQGWTRPVRDEFMSGVGRAIRGQLIDDENINSAAKQLSALFKQIGKDAKDAGVKGFEELSENPNYLPRVFNFPKLEELEHRIGTQNVKDLFSEAIRKEHPEYDKKLTDRIAHYYVKRMKELRVGSDLGLLQGMTFDDIGWLRQFLKESGADSSEIEGIVSKFAEVKKAQNKDPEGSFRNAKRRTQYDENFAMRFKDQQALLAGRDEMVEVKVSDFLENNVEQLFGRYERAMSGHIGFAKVGIKSEADHLARIGRVEGALEGNLKELKKVKQTADMVRKLITGQPVEDASALTKYARLIRDWNYTTTMNQAGFSQLPDWAALLSKGYVGFTLSHLPEVMATVRRARKGGILNDPVAAMLEEWNGTGSDLYNNQVFNSFADRSEEGVDAAVGTVEHGLRVAGRVTTHISGLGFMNDVATRMAAKAVLWRLAKEAREGGVISSKRLAQLGLDQKMMARIRAQINGTTEHVDADFVGKDRILNFAKWTDVEARDALLSGIFRESRRMVQDEDLGETSAWMHKTLGKVILQFRRFMMVSFTKQILHGANMRDAEVATNVMVGSALAALSYSVQFGMKYAAMKDGKEKERFRETYLTPEAISLAAWSRGNYSSFLPGSIDTLSNIVIGRQFFNNRGSGQQSSFISGNPTLSKLTALNRAAASLIQPLIRGDKQFTQSDAEAWKQIMPFGNFIGADIPFHALTDGLPKNNKDPDPSHINMIWE